MRANPETSSRSIPPEVGYLTPKEAARYLSISVCELERRRRNGDGPRYARLGQKMVRYAIHELDAWMNSHTVANNAEADERAQRPGEDAR